MKICLLYTEYCILYFIISTSEKLDDTDREGL